MWVAKQLFVEWVTAFAMALPADLLAVLFKSFSDTQRGMRMDGKTAGRVLRLARCFPHDKPRTGLVEMVDCLHARKSTSKRGQLVRLASDICGLSTAPHADAVITFDKVCCVCLCMWCSKL